MIILAIVFGFLIKIKEQNEAQRLLLEKNKDFSDTIYALRQEASVLKEQHSNDVVLLQECSQLRSDFEIKVAHLERLHKEFVELKQQTQKINQGYEAEKSRCEVLEKEIRLLKRRNEQLVANNKQT